MVKPEKKEEVKVIKKKITDSEAVILADYRGLTVQEINELRSKLKDTGVELKIHKNTLFKIAAEKCGLSDLEDLLTGPTAMAFCKDKPIESSKLLYQFSKAHKVFQIKGAILEGSVIEKEKVIALAMLPSREELIAKLVGSLKAPISRLVGTLNNPAQKLVLTLNQIAEQKA